MGDNWINTAGVIKDALRTLCFWLCSFIYEAVIIVYNIFEKLCGGRFLDNKMLESFAQRVGVILGLVMAFIVIFTIIKMVLDPDKISDKEMGVTALLRKIIIVVIMLGFSNFVFNALYIVQKTVVESDAITKLLLPIQIDTSTSDDFGSILAVELIGSFYYVDPAMESNSEAASCVGYINEFKNQVVEFGNFQLGYQCLNTTVDDPNGAGPQYVVYYNALISVIIGAVVAYFVFVYCIKVGIRMVQLMFLEIIAPLAIVSYALPKKDTMFSKWLKMYISTYIDVFIRIAIINFVAFLIAVLFANEESFIFWGTIGEVTSKEKNWITVIIVIALLTFAKKMPELLGGLIGKGDSKLGFGVSSPKQLFDGMLGGSTIRKGLTTGAKVATAGTALGLLSSIASGNARYRENIRLGATRRQAAKAAAFGGMTALGSGLIYGGKNGFKNLKKGLETQAEKDNKYVNLRRRGGTVEGALGAKMSDMLGDSLATKDAVMLDNIGTAAGYLSSAKSAADEMFFVKQAKETWEKAVQWEGESQEAFNARRESYRKAYKDLQKAAINYVLTGETKGLDYKVEVKEKVQKYDKTTGQPIIGEYEEKVTGYEDKNYASEIAGDHDAALAYKKIENVFSKTKTLVKDRVVEYYDQDGNVHKLKFVEGNSIEAKRANAELFRSLGDKSADTEYVVGERGGEIHKAEAEYAGVKINTNVEKK